MIDKQQLDAELTAILPYLSGWKLDPTYANHTWCAVLIDDVGRGIHVNATQAKGRLYIGGMWPIDSDRQQHRPDKPLHITIARNRPPEKIAAEIERRFLPWYLAAYAEQLKWAEQHNTSRNRQQEVTVELAALLGPEASRRMQSNPNQIYAPGLTVDVHGNGESVSIQLRYKSLKVAKAVLKAIVKAGGVAE
jgi:hypothetical protein